MTEASPTAVIVDIVDSRQIDDRAAAQAAIERAFAAAGGHPLQPARATVGDEFQALFRDLDAAVVATTIVSLGLPEGLALRFGLGRGEVRDIGEGAGGTLHDGPGWWAAREAIEEAHRREDGRTPAQRSWFVDSARDSSRGAEATTEGRINAFLLLRDHLVDGLTPRARRIALGLIRGRTQAQIAADEEISQSAVSQTLRGSGVAALLAALEQLGPRGRTADEPDGVTP